jgi:hypothetical protein
VRRIVDGACDRSDRWSAAGAGNALVGDTANLLIDADGSARRRVVRCHARRSDWAFPDPAPE